jgi:hypothetical protein
MLSVAQRENDKPVFWFIYLTHEGLDTTIPAFLNTIFMIMLDLFAGLDTHVAITLILSLGFVLAFEFINGFHDTANAVATVIYTQSMKPRLAVFASGVFNFLGVLTGGLALPMPLFTCCRLICWFRSIPHVAWPWYLPC